MAYLGLNPSEHSSSATIRRGAITKTGNAPARTCLIEEAWTYRFPARVTSTKTLFAGHTPTSSKNRPFLKCFSVVC
jgi:transposase